MRFTSLFTLLTAMMVLSSFNIVGQETWIKVLGGSEDDKVTSVITTTNGGFVLVGYTKSNDGDFRAMNKGGIDYDGLPTSDIFVVRIDRKGSVIWKLTLGGSQSEEASAIVGTPDGGFAITGYTESNDGDFKRRATDKDIFVVRLDANGQLLWKKFYGGTLNDEGNAIVLAGDGGFYVTGGSGSNDYDFDGMKKGIESDNYSDIFVLKLDNVGRIVWSTKIGGSSVDRGYSICSTQDGGCIITGETASNDYDYLGMHKGGSYGGEQLFVLKLDKDGQLQMNKVFGGKGHGRGQSVVATNDNCFLIAGSSSTNDGDFAGMCKGGEDIVVMKLDSRGDVVWKKMYGGKSEDFSAALATTVDTGFVMVGYTKSKDGDFSGQDIDTYYGSDLIIKCDPNGMVQWKKSIKTSGYHKVTSVLLTADGGFAQAGWTEGFKGDLKGLKMSGKFDTYLIKISADGR